MPEHATLVLALQAAVKRLLSDSEDVVREDVGPLIKTVVATNKFEREMAALFGGGGKDEDEDDLQVCNSGSCVCHRRLVSVLCSHHATVAVTNISDVESEILVPTLATYRCFISDKVACS